MASYNVLCTSDDTPVGLVGGNGQTSNSIHGHRNFQHILRYEPLALSSINLAIKMTLDNKISFYRYVAFHFILAAKFNID